MKDLVTAAYRSASAETSKPQRGAQSTASGGGPRPRSALPAPARETKPAELGLGSSELGARDFCFRVAAMAVANSSPVNPVVFFDVSIGGQVRSRKTQPCAE